MKTLRYILLICFLFVLVSCGTEELPEEHTFPDDEYAVNATDMAVVGDRIYYISGEKVYETVSDTVVFEKFPAEFISSNGTELAIYGNGQVWCGEKTYTIPQSEINSFVYADGTCQRIYRNRLAAPDIVESDLRQSFFHVAPTECSVRIHKAADFRLRNGVGFLAAPYLSISVYSQFFPVGSEKLCRKFLKHNCFRCGFVDLFSGDVVDFVPHYCHVRCIYGIFGIGEGVLLHFLRRSIAPDKHPEHYYSN